MALGAVNGGWQWVMAEHGAECWAGAGGAGGNWCFLFNSFISELEAGTGSAVMKGADGAKLGGVANNGVMWSDWERMEDQAQQADARLRSGTKMAKGKSGNEKAMKSTGRVCSGGQGTGFISHVLQKSPQGGGSVHLCRFGWSQNSVSEFQQNPKNVGAGRAARGSRSWGRGTQ